MSALIQSPVGRLLPRVGLIRYRSADDRLITLPVEIADGGDGGPVVTVARSSQKTWWKHFRTSAPVEVFRRGMWATMHGSLEDRVSGDTRYVRLTG